MAKRQLTPEQRERKRATAHARYLRVAEKERAAARAWNAANKERRRQWREQNREKVRSYFRKWAAGNPEHQRERDRKRRAENPAKRKAELAKWKAANAEECRVHVRNRNARLRDAPGAHTATDIERLLVLQEGKCAACAVPLIRSGKGRFHVDHIVPLKPRKGNPQGTNDPSNLQLLCPPCNISKHNSDPREWKQRLASH